MLTACCLFSRSVLVKKLQYKIINNVSMLKYCQTIIKHMTRKRLGKLTKDTNIEVVLLSAFQAGQYFKVKIKHLFLHMLDTVIFIYMFFLIRM